MQLSTLANSTTDHEYRGRVQRSLGAVFVGLEVSERVRELVDGRPTVSRRHAVLAILGLWSVGWLVSTVRAIERWINPRPPGTGSVAVASDFELVAAALDGWGTTAAFVALCLLVLRWAGVRVRDLRLRPRTRRDVVDEAAVAGGWILAALAGAIVSSPLPSYGYPHQEPGTRDGVLQILTFGLAGPKEEIFFTAVIVLIGRRAGLGWAPIVVCSAVLRFLFHTYYGPSSIGYAVWGALVVGIYIVSGRVLGLVLAHAWWNTIHSLRVIFPQWEATLMITEISVYLILLGVDCYVLIHRSQPRRPDRVGGRDGGTS